MYEWTSLSTEILNNIFQQLDNVDVERCSLTCWAWKPVAQRNLFKVIRRLTDQDVIDLIHIEQKSKLSSLPGKYVKIVDCSTLSDRFLFANLDIVFPFLEVIDIDSNQSVLYNKLYQEMLKGGFWNLKKSPLRKQDQDHVNSVWNQKSKIKKLELHDGDPYCRNKMYETIDSIHLFRNLKTLKLNCFETGTKIYFESLFRRHLPSLETIDFRFTSGSLSLEMPLDLDTIQPLPSVRELTLKNHGLFFNGEESYYYFMKKFPNVQRLYLESEDFGSVQGFYYKEPTVETLSKFLLYLFNVKEECTVRPIVTNPITAELVKNFFKQALDQNSRTTNYKRIHLKIALYIEKPMRRRPPYSPSLEKRISFPGDCKTYIEATNKCQKKINFN